MSTAATPMKEVARRKITVTSSFNEIPTDQLGNRVGRGGRRYSTSLHSFLQQAAEQIFKDDVNGFLPPRIFVSFLLHRTRCLDTVEKKLKNKVIKIISIFKAGYAYIRSIFCYYFEQDNDQIPILSNICMAGVGGLIVVTTIHFSQDFSLF